MDDFTGLAERYIAVWNESDPVQRRLLVEQLWSGDARYVDPLADVSGHDGIDTMIGAVQGQFPGMTFSLTGDVDAHHEQARFCWELGAEGSAALVFGFDVALRGPDGRLGPGAGFPRQGAHPVSAPATVADDVPIADPATAQAFRVGPLIVLLAGTFMTFLDFFIVNVAIPDLQVDLHAGTGAVQFVVAGYGLAFAVGLITGGRLGDIHGRRRVFATGMALFVVTSAICGVAPSTGTLIAARVAQGAAAALLTPQVLALLGALYTGAHRIKAFTAYGLVMGLAGVFGQLVGGALIQTDAGLGWRAIFFINVPVGLASLVFLRVVPESRGARARLDLVGTALLTGGLAGALVPLVEGREQGWRAWTWVSFAGAAVLLVAFAAHQTRLHRAGGSPLVRPDLFGERAFSVGVGVALTFCLGLASFWLILALFLQDGHGLSPLRSGALFTAAGAGFLGAMIAVPALTARLGRHVLTVGAGVTAVGYLTAAATAAEIGPRGSADWLAPALLVAGTGIGMVLVPLSDTVLARVTPDYAASAAGVLSTALEVGGAVGVAAVGGVYFGSLGGGDVTHAFVTSTVVMACAAVAAGALAWALPERTGAQRCRSGRPSPSGAD